MRVRMKIQISGTRDGQDWPPPGGVIDLPDAEAGYMIGTGAAEDASKPPAKSDAGEDQAAGTALRAEVEELRARVAQLEAARPEQTDGAPGEDEPGSEEPAFGDAPETATAPDTAERRGRGRPRKPRDDQGNIIQE